MGVLDGVKVVEFAALGPGPVCAMFLADMGADVVVVDRKGGEAFGPAYFINRGKRSIGLDLKADEDLETAKSLLAWADVVIEGYRPGVMERIGLGPEVALSINPSLVYGRMTGWGQEGPMASAAGHDGNYVALAGGYWFAGEPGEKPHLPATLVGDIGGGTMFLLSGILAGLLRAQKTGEGQVVDAAIVDGVANLLTLQLVVATKGFERGRSVLDSHAPWSQMYQCACGGYVKVATREDKFYADLLKLLGLDDEFTVQDRQDATTWPALERRMTSVFAAKTREEWAGIFDGSDACATAVLSPSEAAAHPHLAARATYFQNAGRLQPAPAPRFSSTPSTASRRIPEPDQDRESILADIALPS